MKILNKIFKHKHKWESTILQKEVDRLSENNLAMQEEMARTWNKLQLKEKIIKEAINYIKEESWFCYKDNEEVIDRTPVERLLEILGDNDENI